MSDSLTKVRLGDLISELPKSTLPAAAAEDAGPYFFYCSSSIPKRTNAWLQDKPTILMGTGGVASIHFGQREFSYSTDTWAFRIREQGNLLQEFAYRVLEKDLSKIDYAGFEGSGLRHLRKNFIRNYVVHVPEITEQTKACNIFSTIDTAIEQTEALIEKYQHIKSGLIRDLFTRGVLPNGQLRPPREQAPEMYQETAIGWIPKEWQYELLDNLAHRGSGHTPNKDYPEYWNGGIKWVSLADSNKLDQLYITDTELEISHKGIVNSSAVLHPAGIVVLSRDAGVGKSAITTDPMAVSQHFMCWKCDQKMDNHFLYYWMQFNKRTFENIAMGSTILTIGLPYFKRLRIACPVGLLEQEAIAERLKTTDIHIFSMQAELMKLRKEKYGLMQDLLTGKVPVKDEPEALEAAGG
jgi:type I restriction enzyme S subunit